MMIDTTCDNARTLHFLQTDFAYDGTLVDLASSTAPLQSYQAPGAFKETGDGRKYTFLLYGQPENKNVSSLKLPSQGDVFMVKNFEDQNGYIDPQAGIGMVVDLGGTVNCGAAQSGGVNSVAQTAAASSAIASSGGAPSAAPSSAAPSAVSSASLASQVTPSISFESPSSTSRSVSSTAGPKATSVSSGVVAASSVLVGGASGTTLAMSGKTTATGTVSGTAAAATQTGSEASSMSLAIARCVVVASLIAFAGLLAY
ncbi:hypothetical protein K432DRAFT_384086 [Lepidopterella palustris CBS 459.81]|uniref:Uncharacterized protein n=1 Tax=Lepidopterella palustris CBS 459.81 TaxID=1314670 RepID=A0A8E2JD23_9PEZI|nr:hypothetical protein K432DRAFT_384086 [Lepidopterella palustris CBS 459.81]